MNDLNTKTFREKIQNFLNKITPVFKSLILYIVVLSSVVASFFVGKYYTKILNKNEPPAVEVTTFVKSDVNLAIDENNHLIIIDKKTGNYKIYQDSIGNTIFRLYAKSMWNQSKEVTK